jgi:hypothetical protein
MRMITKAADKLLGKLAPKAAAAAACMGESYEYCDLATGIYYFVDACGRRHKLGTC